MEVLVEEMKKGGPVWTPGIVKSKLKESVRVVFEQNDSNAAKTTERCVKYSSIRKSTADDPSWLQQNQFSREPRRALRSYTIIFV